MQLKTFMGHFKIPFLLDMHQRCGVGHERMRVSPQDRANSEPSSVATRRRQEEGDAQIIKMKNTRAFIYSFALFLVLGLAACTGSKVITEQTAAKEAEAQLSIDTSEITDLSDTLDIDEQVALLSEPDFEEPGIYRSKAQRHWDLLHTSLDLSFDWPKQRVNGKAELTLTPFFYPDSTLELDAKHFDWHYIGIEGHSDSLNFDYDSLKVNIHLGRLYDRRDTLIISLHYTAKPAERPGRSGSSAITSDQGLFFINHDGRLADKPQQIWTQGETEYNSAWFPTIDKPNERCTHDIKLTVEDRFTTLSNGLLVESVKGDNGMRTDHWVMDLPHAPYLFMIAIGEYAVIKDRWQDISLSYMVEPEYAPYAKDIFAHTPEMLTFFSETFGVPYPWQKYDQVIVRDYVSGAMENTTAVIFGDFVQRTRRQLMDNGNDEIVAHEMAHHWFGDLVTCADWSQLTLNEGFANYSEYLWLEHKYGFDHAEQHRRNELSGYLNSLEYTGTKHLIRYDYESAEEMFDAHSYNKGGLVLHMLRHYLGDDAFFSSLKHYLQVNAYKPVEIHQLRLAFEETTGEDLSWFFNQWFLDRGHPELKVDHFYDRDSSRLYVTAHQMQDPGEHRPIFRLPLDIHIYLPDGQIRKERMWTDNRSSVLELSCDTEPVDVIFDPQRILLATLDEDWALTPDKLLKRAEGQNHYTVQLKATSEIAEKSPEHLMSVLEQQIEHPFWRIRRDAIRLFPADSINASRLRKISYLAKADPNLYVRYAALNKLSSIEGFDETSALVHILSKGERESGLMVGKALQVLHKIDEDLANQWKDSLINDDDPQVIVALSEIILATKDTTSADFFSNNFLTVSGYESITFMTNAFATLGEIDRQALFEFTDSMYQQLQTRDSGPLNRYGFMQFLGSVMSDLSNDIRTGEINDMEALTNYFEKYSNMFESIKSKETVGQLKSAYEYLRP